ncbi:MAG: DUF4403 family protein [Bacteroidales bacterium]|nr:DUF4403 family protein [Bacteroidales bacterium]
MRVIQSLLLFVALTLIQSCSSTKLPTEKPAENYVTFNYDPVPSTISLPVEMKVTALEALLNRQLTGLIYADTSLDNNGGDNIMVKAWKKDNIKIGFENGQFIYRVPLKLWIKAGWKIQQFGISLSDYRELNAEIALKFRSSVVVNKDWSVTTVTTSDGYEWITKPTLKIGPVDLPITFIADMIIKYNTKTINSAIDAGLTQSLDLKTTAKEAWVEVQKPMLLSEEYGLWLRISPKSVSAMPVTGGKGIIKHTSSIQGVAEVFTGKQPPSKINDVLPELTTATKLSDEFLANVVSYISYDYLDSITRLMLINTSYTYEKKKITITGISVYGNESRMIIATDVTGSINGKLYFSGLPMYRTSDSSIILKDLQFSVQTKNVLLKSASWLANSGIEKMIGKKMAYPIGTEIRETYDMMVQSLNKYEIGQGFIMTGKLNGMEVQQPVLAPTGIIAPVSITGKLSVKLE